MCYPCIGCGLCGQPVIKMGTCQYCGAENPPETTVCPVCGMDYPAPAGVDDWLKPETSSATSAT